MPEIAKYLTVAALVASLVGVQLWRSVALRLGFVAIPNKRTMHSGAVPVGGGIVISVVWLGSIAVLFALGHLSLPIFLALFFGGLGLTVLGVIDDAMNLGALTKFGGQIGIVVWAFYWVGDMPPFSVLNHSYELGWLGFFLGGLLVLWLLNLFNFIDGIDGLCASGSVFVSTSMAVILHIEQMYLLSLLLYLLAMAVAGFLWFNWPPAKLFMGDSGSVFLGYVLGVLMFVSSNQNPALLWVWLITMSYFLADATTTLLLRVRYVKPFYVAHRHHAYQTLASRLDSHLRVTSYLVMLKLLWLLPLAVLAYLFPKFGFFLFLVAFLPVALFCAKQGVLYQLKQMNENNPQPT